MNNNDYKIDYLVTTINRDFDEILELIKKSNIRLGNIIIGNQGCSHDSFQDLSTNKQKIYVFNLSSKGVSKNRNFLLSKASSEYVTFWDDDQVYLPNKECFVTEYLNKYFEYNVIRFNVSKKNLNYKQIHRNKKLNFINVAKFGSWGIFIKRIFLVNNNIFFNECIGPGTDIIFGEDTNFNYKLIRKNGIFQVDFNPIILESDRPSTWKGLSLETKIVSEGATYYITYKKMVWILLFIHLIKYNSFYSSLKLKTILSLYNIGIKKGKKILKEDMIYNE